MSSKSKMSFFCLTIVFVLQTYLFAVTPLPRIKARSHTPYGEFYLDTPAQRTFSPVGNSLVKIVEGYHGNFFDSNTSYCPAKVEHDLTKMQACGYNVVRCWIYPGNSTLNSLGIYGTGGPATYDDGPELYEPYMNNVIDFIERCTSHKIYIIFCMDGVPFNEYYHGILDTGDPNIENINRFYLADGGLEAKAIYLTEFLNWIKDEDPNLLSTVFSYEIDNEVYCTTSYKPFSSGSPEWIATADGESYHMTNYDPSSTGGRQACMDNNINHWANECIAAIHAVDADAFVSVSVYPPIAKGHSSSKLGLPIGADIDPDWSARAAKLRVSDINFTDIHLYLPWDMDDCLTSCEWSSLNLTAKPFFVGEFGAHRDSYSLADASTALYNWRKDFYTRGFSGSSLFTFDSRDNVTTRWAAMDGGGTLLGDLSLYTFENKWGFNSSTAGKEGWVPTPTTSWTVSGGKLTWLSLNPATFYMTQDSVNIDSDMVKFVKIRMQNDTNATQMRLYWLTDTDGTWDENKAQWKTCSGGDTSMKEYVFDMRNEDYWSGNITKLRFYPAHGSFPAANVYIDYILATSSPADNNDNRVGTSNFGTWLMENVAGGYVPDVNTTRANNLLLFASPETPTRVAGGYTGYALSFDGNDRARSTDYWDTSKGNMVFECRISPDNIWSTGENQWFFNLNKGVALSCRDRRFYMRVYKDDVNFVEIQTERNYDNNYYYLLKAAVCTDGTFALWVVNEDGEASESIAGSTNTGSWNRLPNEYIYLGSSRYSTLHFAGQLDNVTIWSY